MSELNEPKTDSPSTASAERARYWRANLRIMTILLSIWLIAGLGCGVLLADVLNQVWIGGYPLGFWFAQQGSIIVFVLLILIYCIALNRLDRRHHQILESSPEKSSREESD